MAAKRQARVWQLADGTPLDVSKFSAVERQALTRHYPVPEAGGPTVVDETVPLGRPEPGEDSIICKSCSLRHQGAEHPFIEASGAQDPIITLVVDGVSSGEDSSGRLGSGPAAMILKYIDALPDQPVPMDRIRVVGASRCAPRLKPMSNAAAIARCSNFLVRDLAEHPPNLIIALGSAALGALSHKSNAQEWGGRLLTYRGWPDSWLTNPAYMRQERPFHPVHGYPPGPDSHRPLVPLQTPRVVYATANPVMIARWREQIKRAVHWAVNGAPPKVYVLPHYRLSTDVDEVERALRWLIEHPGTQVVYDTETTGLRPWMGQHIVFMMFRFTGEHGLTALGFPWDYPESPLQKHLDCLRPLVLEALQKSRVGGHNLTFDMLFTSVTLGDPSEYPAVTDGQISEAWRNAERRLSALADASAWDTWHMAYCYRQERGSLGLEALAYTWAPAMAGYEEDMTLLISLYPDKLHPDQGGHYAACPLDKWETHLKPYVLGDVETAAQANKALTKALTTTPLYSIPLASIKRRGEFRLFTPPNRAWVYATIMAPAAALLTKMMGRGMQIDLDVLRDLEITLPKEIRALRAEIAKVTPAVEAWCQEQEATDPNRMAEQGRWEFDPEDKEQLREVLFRQLRLQVQRLTKTGRKLYGEDPNEWDAKIAAAVCKRNPQISDEMLDFAVREERLAMAAMDKFTLNRMAIDHPKEIRPLQEYRKVFKLYGTYVRPLRNIMVEGVDKKALTRTQHLCPDNRLHAQFLLTGTRGGRLCVAGDTVLEVRVNDESPEHIEIRDLWKLKDQNVSILTHRGRWRPIKSLFYKGKETMYEVQIHGVRSFTATAQHRVYTKRGWVDVGSLTQWDTLCVGTPSRVGAAADRGQFTRPGVGAQMEAVGRIGTNFEEGGATQLEGLSEHLQRPALAVSGASALGSEGQFERTEEAVSDTSRGGVSRTFGTWNVRGAYRSKVQDDAVFSHTEYPGVWAIKIGGSSGGYKQDDRAPASRNRARMPRNQSGFQAIPQRQGGLFYESLRGLRWTVTAGVVFERFVPQCLFPLEGIQFRPGRNMLVDEQARAAAFQGTDCGQNSSLQRVSLQWTAAGGFRNFGHESVDRSRRRISHKRRRSAERGDCDTLGISGNSIYNTAGCLRDGGCAGEDKNGSGRVDGVRCIGEKEVWDIEVEEDHSYLAHGVFHHNSSRSPNLQNLPKRGTIKRMFVSRFGQLGCLYGSDFSQIELRLLAAACGDTSMVEAYEKGLDLHSLTASRIFNVPYEQFSKENFRHLEAEGETKVAKDLKLKRDIAKCVDPETLVSVDGKIVRIGSLHSGREADTFYPLSGQVQVPSGLQPLRQFYSSGCKPRLLVCARHGLLACSHEHRLALADGRLIKAQDLRVGMVLAKALPLVCETGAHSALENARAYSSGLLSITGHQIQPWLFNASSEAKLSFLSGLADAGIVCDTGCVRISARSWVFAQDLMVLARSVGVLSSMYRRRSHRPYVVTLRAAYVLRDGMKRGKRLRLKHLDAPMEEAENRVTLVEPLPDGDLVEIALDAPHLYVANGLAGHNTTNFLTGYGGGAFGLQNVLAASQVYLPIEECEAIIAAFFSGYPALRDFLAYYKCFIKQSKAAVSIFGRVRAFEEVESTDDEIVSKALRAGCNHVIQSTASDMMLVCMVVIEQLMREAKLDSMLVSTVHDSLVIDAVRTELPQVHEIVSYVVNNIPEVFKLYFGEHYDTSWMLVKFAGDAEVGLNYHDMRGVPDQPDWDKLLAPESA